MERERGAGPGGSGAAAVRRTLATLALAAALSGAPAARATCPGDPPALAALADEERIAFLRERLDAARPATEAWTATWALVDGATALGQVALIPFTADTPDRLVLLGGAASSMLGLLQMAFLPITVPPLPPPDPSRGACATLSELEWTLARAARNEALGSGAGAHLGNVAINAALAIGAGLASGRWQDGALAFGFGIAVGEAQILTQPTALVGARARYLAGDLRAGGAPAARIGIARGGGLFSVALRF